MRAGAAVLTVIAADAGKHELRPHPLGIGLVRVAGRG